MKYDVTLAWENHRGTAGLFLGFWLEVLQKMPHPRPGVNFDSGNGVRAGQHPLEFLRETEISGRLVHVHVKEFQRVAGGGLVMNPREGDVADHREILSPLKGIGYHGWISWEHAYGTPSRDDLALAAQVMPFLRELWEQA